MKTTTPKIALRLGRLAAALTLLGLVLFALTSGVSGLERVLTQQNQTFAPSPEPMLRYQSILVQHRHQLSRASLIDGPI
jgi:hypothetical protein